jgi:hypothetical protein
MKVNEGSTFRSVKPSLSFPSLAVPVKDFLHICNETQGFCFGSLLHVISAFLFCQGVCEVEIQYGGLRL